jgi:hypothetical protein
MASDPSKVTVTCFYPAITATFADILSTKFVRTICYQNKVNSIITLARDEQLHVDLSNESISDTEEQEHEDPLAHTQIQHILQ